MSETTRMSAPEPAGGVAPTSAIEQMLALCDLRESVTELDTSAWAALDSIQRVDWRIEDLLRRIEALEGGEQ